MKSFFLVYLLLITVPTVTSFGLMNKFHCITKIIKRNNRRSLRQCCETFVKKGDSSLSSLVAVSSHATLLFGSIVKDASSEDSDELRRAFAGSADELEAIV